MEYRAEAFASKISPTCISRLRVLRGEPDLDNDKKGSPSVKKLAVSSEVGFYEQMLGKNLQTALHAAKKGERFNSFLDYVANRDEILATHSEIEAATQARSQNSV